jgi:hypothetical protein
MTWRIALLAIGLTGFATIPANAANESASSESVVTVHCIMPITPSQVSEFDVDLAIDVTVAGRPTSGEVIVSDTFVARRTWWSRSGPSTRPCR